MNKIPSEIAEHRSAWKMQYGEVFYLPVGEGFVLRPFTLGEFKRYAIHRQVDAMEAESQIIQTCLLWPEGFDVEDLNQADFEFLSQKLLEFSPFDNHDRFIEKLEIARIEADSLHSAIYIHIQAAFPSLTEEMIDLLNPDRLIKTLAQAEKILQRPLEIEGEQKGPPTPVLPEEVQVLNAQKAVAKNNARKERIAAIRQRASGMSPTDIPQIDDQDRLSLLKDMRDMQRMGLGPPPDAGP